MGSGDKGSPEVARAVDLYALEKSIPQIAEELGWPRSRVRTELLKAGVIMRNRFDAMRMAKRAGRGLHRGGSYVRTQETRARMSKSARARGDRSARGYRIKPSGYVELTRGPDKGRLLHDVIGEVMVGRPLRRNEMVHHKDEVRSHNDFDNLQVMTRSEHARLHALERIARGERMESHFTGGHRGISQ